MLKLVFNWLNSVHQCYMHITQNDIFKYASSVDCVWWLLKHIFTPDTFDNLNALRFVFAPFSYSKSNCSVVSEIKSNCSLWYINFTAVTCSMRFLSTSVMLQRQVLLLHVLVETSTELSRLETHCIKSPLDRHLHFFSY